MTYSDAIETCQRDGSRLILVDSDTKYDFMVDQIGNVLIVAHISRTVAVIY